MPGARRPLIAVLAASFLFNLGQGVLRPSLPLYLQSVFAARYQMVTLIPVVFGLGKWVASLPTGYLLGRLGRRPLMVGGLLVMAAIDVASVTTAVYGIFLGYRALGGVGWAMFATVATTVMIDVRAAGRRGRAVSVLMMSEALGLAAGSMAGGWLYQSVGATSPFFLEAACMTLAAVVVGGFLTPPPERPGPVGEAPDQGALTLVLRTPGVLLMSVTNAVLVAIQTGVFVFLVPLYLANRAGADPGTVGVLVSLSVVGRVAGLWLGGGVSDRVGRMRVLVPGLVVYAALLASLGALTHPIVLGAWSLGIGGAIGFVAPLPTALVGDRVAPTLHGVAMGWLRTMGDTGHIAGALAMGALADATDLAVAFVAGGALLLLTAGLCHVRR